MTDYQTKWSTKIRWGFCVMSDCGNTNSHQTPPYTGRDFTPLIQRMSFFSSTQILKHCCNNKDEKILH